MPDPRLHGPASCPNLSRHHWVEATVADLDSAPDQPDVELKRQAQVWFACRYCPAWAEREYVWESEELT